jgi:hypothetical protein
VDGRKVVRVVLNFSLFSCFFFLSNSVSSTTVDETALKCVGKALAARNVTEVPQYVGWLDKINQRDKKVRLENQQRFQN